MEVTFSRRDVLRLGGVAATTTVGGCLSGEIGDPGPPPGHIYAENGSGEDRELLLVVAEREDDMLDYNVQGRYRVPDGYALQFEGVLEPDVAHVVRVALPGSPPEDLISTTVDRCTDNPSQERVVSVTVQPDGLGIITRGCEEEYSERDLDYVAAADHQIATIDRKLTPTPED